MHHESICLFRVAKCNFKMSIKSNFGIFQRCLTENINLIWQFGILGSF